jgi:hypothetical protein
MSVLEADNAKAGGEISTAETLQKPKRLLCALELCKDTRVAVIHEEIRHRKPLPATVTVSHCCRSGRSAAGRGTSRCPTSDAGWDPE